MSKKKILIIDDEYSLTRLIKMQLEKAGDYEVDIENSGTSAVDTVKKTRPDVILLDIVMPDADGRDIVISLSEDSELASIPIIFTTAALVQDRDDQDHDLLNRIPVLQKPLEMPALIEEIERVSAS